MTLLKRLKTWLRPLPGYELLRFLYRLVRDTSFRQAAPLLVCPPANLFQPYATTGPDRYPHIFQQARELVGDGAERHLLSFGCATGEEVFALRQRFALARLTGLDINSRNIALCRARQRQAGDDRMFFRVAGSTVGDPDRCYDAIFAMAVFRHGDLNTLPPPLCSAQRIRFADFENCVGDLVRCLKPGGLLVIHHAQFRFTDTVWAAGFQTVIRVPDDSEGRGGQIYGRDNRLLALRGCEEIGFQASIPL